MRPVNLIPPEDRRGGQSPLRTGPLAYVVLGGLVALLAGVALLVVTGNEISERKDEIVSLKREDKIAEARAQRLDAYVQFAQLRQQRVETISSLANSRFDWERVMRELSKILPDDVWLTSLNASAAAGAAGVESGGAESGSGLRGSIAGPALEISGCANGQEGVAGFVNALKEIDGVTRVGVQSAALAAAGSSASGGGGSEGGGGSGGTDCRTRSFISQFQVVAAFDAAPAPVTTETAEATEAAPEGSEESSSAGEESTSTSGTSE